MGKIKFGKDESGNPAEFINKRRASLERCCMTYYTIINMLGMCLLCVCVADRQKDRQTERHNGILLPVKTSFGLCWRGGTMYQRKVDVDMLNAIKSVLADISSVSPSSEQRDRWPNRKTVIISNRIIHLFGCHILYNWQLNV